MSYLHNTTHNTIPFPATPVVYSQFSIYCNTVHHLLSSSSTTLSSVHDPFHCMQSTCNHFSSSVQVNFDYSFPITYVYHLSLPTNISQHLNLSIHFTLHSLLHVYISQTFNLFSSSFLSVHFPALHSDTLHTKDLTRFLSVLLVLLINYQLYFRYHVTTHNHAH